MDISKNDIGPLCDWLNGHSVDTLEELEELLRRAQLAKGFWSGEGLRMYPPDPIEVFNADDDTIMARLYVQEGYVELV